jgi:hypothetical protein
MNRHRRDFIAALGGMAVVWPFVAAAQQGVAEIGWLSSASSRGYAPMIAAFRKALAEAGFIEGKNIKIEYVWAPTSSITGYPRWRPIWFAAICSCLLRPLLRPRLR